MGNGIRTIKIRPARSSIAVDPIACDHGWYDITVTLNEDGAFKRRFAGHVEHGTPSVTG